MGEIRCTLKTILYCCISQETWLNSTPSLVLLTCSKTTTREVMHGARQVLSTQTQLQTIKQKYDT